MNNIDGLPKKDCTNFATFIKRFSLKPTYNTRAKGQCISCNYTTDKENPISQPCPFTSDQLAMRRKAEILQYKNNASFNGRLTKAQKYSLMAKRKGPDQKTYGTQTQTYTNPNTLEPKSTNPASMPVTLAYNNLRQMPSSFTPKHRQNCQLIKTSTHASGVPGPEMKLFMDESVPLTDYVVRRNYSGNHSRSDFIFVPLNVEGPSGTIDTLFVPSKDKL